MQRLERVDPEVAQAIADFIDRVLRARGDARVEGEVRADGVALTKRFPFYPDRLR